MSPEGVKFRRVANCFGIRDDPSLFGRTCTLTWFNREGFITERLGNLLGVAVKQQQQNEENIPCPEDL